MHSLPIDAAKAVDQSMPQQHWAALLQSAGDGIWGVDSTGNCTFVNRMALDIFGFTSEEMLGQHMHTLVHHHREDGTDFPAEECPVHGMMHGKEPLRRRPYTLFRKDSSAFAAEMSADPVEVDGLVVGAVVTCRDVGEQREQREELRRARAEADRLTAVLKAVLESVPHGIFIASADGSVGLNSRAREMTGAEFPRDLSTLERAGRGEYNSEMFCASEWEQESESKEASSGMPGSVTKTWIHSVGVPVISKGEVIGAVAVNTDITRVRLQEDALRKAENLAAIGQLASSIAHEINDPLESITNLLYLLQHSSSMEEVAEYANMAQIELQRVTEITQQTLRFNRQRNKPVYVNVAGLIETILSLYTGRFLVRGITLEKRLLGAPEVFCQEGEIRQIFNNLIRNAIDAMERGGRLSVRLHRSTRANGVPGVRILIADSGEGISQGIMGHLFEPFRTTKELTGTGLGLWVSKGIVDKHGGSITVRTRRVKPSFTVFSVWLPQDGDAGSELSTRP